MFKYIILILFATSAQGGEYVLGLEKMEFNYSHLDPKTRDPYLPEYTGRWKEQVSTKFRLGLIGGRFYWDNNVHGETVETGVFKSVGWQWEAGIRLTKQFVLYHEHHSRHVMEQSPEKRFDAGSQFPVEDSFGIKLILIEETKGRSIFK